MNFSKLKLQEGQATGDYTGLAATKKVSDNATQGGVTAKNDMRTGHEKQLGQGTQRGTYGGTRANRTTSKQVDIQASKIYNDEYFEKLITEKQQIKAFESQKSDWREDLQEKLADGQEREDHPFVTVMPTGDENLIQAIKQMRGEVKDKKEKVGTGANVQEEVELLDEAKKKECKDGYKYDSDKKKCVKKKKKSSSKKSSSKVYVVGRPFYGGHHHHDHDDKEDNNTDNGSDGGDAGGGEGGGMGEMFDYLGDMLLQEKEWNLRDAQKAGVTVGDPKKPVDWKTKNEKIAAKKTVIPTSMKDRAKD